QVKEGSVANRDLIKRLLPTLSSNYLSHMLISRPALAAALVGESKRDRADFLQVMRAAINKEHTPAAKTDALRRAWYQQVVAIGYQDMTKVGEDSLSQSPDLRLNNLAQTALAEAALRLAVEIALESLGIETRDSITDNRP